MSAVEEKHVGMGEYETVTNVIRVCGLRSYKIIQQEQHILFFLHVAIVSILPSTYKTQQRFVLANNGDVLFCF